MMHAVAAILALTGGYPLARAWWANRHTSLLQAIYWAVAAWLTWMAVVVGRAASWPTTPIQLRYLALSLTGCAAIAVLGARRPGNTAWNFVVVGLLAVLLLPVAEGWVLGTGLHFSGLHLLCLAGTLGMGVLNYLPTRLAPAAILLGLGCAGEMMALSDGETTRTGWWLALVPWFGYAGIAWKSPAASVFDRLWLDFRDRFGLVWGQRLREQLNNSAAHAGWPVVLRWRGLRLLPGASLPGAHVQTEMLETLQALMKRFGLAPDGWHSRM